MGGLDTVKDEEITGGDFLFFGKFDGLALAAIDLLRALIKQWFKSLKIIANSGRVMLCWRS